jgi:hypothetical protein
MTAIHYDVILAGAAGGWYRRNREALEYLDSMDRPFDPVEQLGDRDDIHPVGEFSYCENLEGLAIYRGLARVITDLDPVFQA